MSEDLQTKILEVLKNAGEPLTAVTISKQIFGESGARRQVNPTLYKMLSAGLVAINRDDTRPKWRLN